MDPKTYSLIDLFCCSPGPVVCGCSGALVRWSTGPLVPWSFGPLVLWSTGSLAPWSFGPGPVPWSPGPLPSWSSGLLVSYGFLLVLSLMLFDALGPFSCSLLAAVFLQMYHAFGFGCLRSFCALLF